MIPIHKLLNRLRWDPRFREGKFEIGYYDRLLHRILVVPLDALRFPSDPHVFELHDDRGARHCIPFHRVRRVYRNGRVIWERKPAHEPPDAAVP
jgi:uncharacterized protein (UPF0248 family)